MISAVLGAALAISVALTVPTASATTVSTNAKTAFIASISGAAQTAQRTFGVPASVSMAQAIVNSNWGTSTLAKSGKNYWNLRCGRTLTPSGFASLADAQVGKAYVLGAEVAATTANPTKFDCSELVQWLYSRSGNEITDLAAAQYNATKKVTGSPQAGDLVFLRNNPARANGIGHVAILTQKLSSGDWRIIEARGHAYGVVRTTLSYWKQRSYYAGLRRSSNFVLVGTDGVTKMANIDPYQGTCISVTANGSTLKYRGYTSIANSFLDHARIVATEPAYASALSVVSNTSAYIDAIAKIEQPSDAAAYAADLRATIKDDGLDSYNVIPFTLTLESGDAGAKVTALQNLLQRAGYSAKATGKFDAATVSAVKKLQSAKKLTVDGQAGPKTISALMSNSSKGDSGTRATAVRTLLAAAGYATDASGFGATTASSVKAFQSAAGLSASGTVDARTWTKLFMTVNSAAPAIEGSATVAATLTVQPGTWGPSGVALSYQWYRGSTAIDGATATSYALQPADAGQIVRAVVTGGKGVYTSVSRSASTAAVANANLTTTATPKLKGTAKVGSTLSVTTGTWKPAPIGFGYQWYRGTTAIPGATAATYKVQPADVSSTINVALTGSTAGYNSVTKTSAASGKVAKGSLSTGTVTISGSAKVGKTIRVSAGKWKPQAVTLSYRWYRGSTAIKGATKTSYKLIGADRHKTVTVKVHATKDGYNSKDAKAHVKVG